MSEALEERAALEVIKRDEAIEALLKKLDRVEDKKNKLSVEAGDLHVAR